MENMRNIYVISLAALLMCTPFYSRATLCDNVVALSGGAHALVILQGPSCNVLVYLGGSNWDPIVKKKPGTLSVCNLAYVDDHCYYLSYGGFVRVYVAHSHQCGTVYIHYADSFYVYFPHCCNAMLCD